VATPFQILNYPHLQQLRTDAGALISQRGGAPSFKITPCGKLIPLLSAGERLLLTTV